MKLSLEKETTDGKPLVKFIFTDVPDKVVERAQDFWIEGDSAIGALMNWEDNVFRPLVEAIPMWETVPEELRNELWADANIVEFPNYGKIVYEVAG